MSASSTPITPSAFAAAIRDLPLGNLHSKAAELRNSIAHLHHSNEQLQPFAEEGDRECAEAIRENEEVIRRMEERIALLRQEVESRGFRWSEAEVEDQDVGVEQDVNMADGTGEEEGSANGNAIQGAVRENGARTRTGGSLSDEELRRRLAARMQTEMQDDNEGLHL